MKNIPLITFFGFFLFLNITQGCQGIKKSLGSPDNGKSMAMQVVAPSSGKTDDIEGKDYWRRDSVEAIIAAPELHKVLLENDRVRVLEITIPPHKKELLYTYSWPSILYINSGDESRAFNEKGEVVMSREIKNFKKQALTQWVEPESSVSKENLSDVPIHIIRVELKDKQ